MRYNERHYGSPYNISTSALDSHMQLMELLRHYLNRHKCEDDNVQEIVIDK